MRTKAVRITLERLKDGLREDSDFPREALGVLEQVDPQSTHTIATSAESLVDWWLTERELDCYERGEVVKDTTAASLYPDDQGNYEAAMRSIELAWRVDGAEFVLLLLRYDMHVPEFLQDVAPPQAVAPDEGDIGALGRSSACAAFREMQNLNYAEVTIEFAAGDSGGVILNISARGISKRVTPQELDLFDRRKAELNKQGGLLLALAQGQGRSVKNADNNSKRMSRLRVSINRHLGLSGDPFEPYIASQGWVPKFQILDKRGTAKDRAEREANRRMDQLDSPEVMARIEQNQADEHQRMQYDESEQDEAAEWLRDQRSGPTQSDSFSGFLSGCPAG